MGRSGSTLRDYLLQVAALPRLSPGQREALAREVDQGDVVALRALVQSHLPLVVREAAQRRGRGLRFHRLLACGNAALLKALRANPLDPALLARIQAALEDALALAAGRAEKLM